MDALVFGASGIVGQYMRGSIPKGVTARFFRQNEDASHEGFDLARKLDELPRLLDAVMPDVVINLAGENRVDVVEREPDRHYSINVELPRRIASWCESASKHYLHISTQGVFSGQEPPYHPASPRNPVNAYGRQKKAAEDLVMQHRRWTIARLTFVLGIRLIETGRMNPVEDMIERTEQIQTSDRWFSPGFPWDVAASLWQIAQSRPEKLIHHIGLPVRVSRYDIAINLNRLCNLDRRIEAVDSGRFPDIAPRPIDTTWAPISDDRRDYIKELENGLNICYKLWLERQSKTRIGDR